MKSAILSAFVCALIAALPMRAGEEKKPETAAVTLDLKSDKDKASYAVGYDLGMRVKRIAGELNVDVMATSFKEAAAGKQSRLSEAELQKQQKVFNDYMRAKQTPAADGKAAALENKDDVSYAVGQSVGATLKPLAEHFDIDLVGRAFIATVKDEKNDFDQKDPSVAAYFQKIQGLMMEQRKAQGEKNKTDGEAFLAENKRKEGVVTTASGLQYKVLKEGKGEIPSGTDKVSVSYEGRFINNVVFDSTAKHGGEPLETSVAGGVIQGWLEALKLMPQGSKWELYVPSNLAYGENGMGAAIPPNAVLIFQMELLSIKKADAPKLK